MSLRPYKAVITRNVQSEPTAFFINSVYYWQHPVIQTQKRSLQLYIQIYLPLKLRSWLNLIRLISLGCVIGCIESSQPGGLKVSRACRITRGVLRFTLPAWMTISIRLERETKFQYLHDMTPQMQSPKGFTEVILQYNHVSLGMSGELATFLFLSLGDICSATLSLDMKNTITRDGARCHLRYLWVAGLVVSGRQ